MQLSWSHKENECPGSFYLEEEGDFFSGYYLKGNKIFCILDVIKEQSKTSDPEASCSQRENLPCKDF